MTSWRATHGKRFLDRAIQRPLPPPVYVRKTDEEVAALHEAMRPLAITARALADTCAKAASNLQEAFGAPAYGRARIDAIARAEWPHAPLSLARTYAREYLRTGEQP